MNNDIVKYSLRKYEFPLNESKIKYKKYIGNLDKNGNFTKDKNQWKWLTHTELKHYMQSKNIFLNELFSWEHKQYDVEARSLELQQFFKEILKIKKVGEYQTSMGIVKVSKGVRQVIKNKGKWNYNVWIYWWNGISVDWSKYRTCQSLLIDKIKKLYHYNYDRIPFKITEKKGEWIWK